MNMGNEHKGVLIFLLESCFGAYVMEVLDISFLPHSSQSIFLEDT